MTLEKADMNSLLSKLGVKNYQIKDPNELKKETHMGYGDVEIKSNSKYLKIESGVPHDLRLLSASPSSTMIHGFGKEQIECNENGCGECAAGSEPKQRFSAEVYDHSLKRQLDWEFGPGVAKQLKVIDNALKEEGKKITDVDLRVDATGSKMDKKYMVTPRSSAKPLPEGVIPF